MFCNLLKFNAPNYRWVLKNYKLKNKFTRRVF